MQLYGCFFFSPDTSHAGEPLFVPHGAGQAGMAFACTASPGHWNSFHNQALMAGSRDFSAGLSFESRFMMSEMSSKAISLVIPGSAAPLGIIATHFGNGQYSSIFAGVGSALTISEGLSFGLQADLIAETGVGDYRNVYHATFEAGLAARLSPDLTLGLHIFNPLTAVNSLPSSISAGVSWSPSPELHYCMRCLQNDRRAPLAERRSELAGFAKTGIQNRVYELTLIICLRGRLYIRTGAD